MLVNNVLVWILSMAGKLPIFIVLWCFSNAAGTITFQPAFLHLLRLPILPTRKAVVWGLLLVVCVTRRAARCRSLSQYLLVPKLKHSHGNAPAVLISPSLLLFPVAQEQAEGQISLCYTSTALESLRWLQLGYTQVKAKQMRTDSCLTLQQNKSLRVTLLAPALLLPW